MSYTPTVWKMGDLITAQKLNKMENAIHDILSEYAQTNWVDGEIISAEKLNKLENAIEYINLDYRKTVWQNNDIITASLLNNIENGIEIASLEKTWDEMSWNDVIAATRTGRYVSFEVGSTKNLDLGSEGVIAMQIVGVSTDNLANEQGTAPISFIGHNLLNTTHRMNPQLTPNATPYDVGTGAIGGWKDCEMRAYLYETIMNLLPKNIKDNLKEVVKYSNIINTSGTKIVDDVTADKLWIPSAREILGGTNNETSGPVYNGIFTNAQSRIKSIVGNDSGAVWKLRTAYNTITFRGITASGSHDVYSAQGSHGVALGFCL